MRHTQRMGPRAARTQGARQQGLSSSDPHSFLWGLNPQPLVQTWVWVSSLLIWAAVSRPLDGEKHKGCPRLDSGGCRVGGLGGGVGKTLQG